MGSPTSCACSKYLPVPREQSWTPAINAYRCHDRILVCMDLAGVSEQDIELIAEPRRILIRGHRRTRELAAQFGRERGSFEFQMLYGVRPDPEEQLVQ